jgi:hypothetical protein
MIGVMEPAPSGSYKAKIKHITKSEKGKNGGQCLIGISILEKIDQLEG